MAEFQDFAVKEQVRAAEALLNEKFKSNHNGHNDYDNGDGVSVDNRVSGFFPLDSKKQN